MTSLATKVNYGVNSPVIHVGLSTGIAAHITLSIEDQPVSSKEVIGFFVSRFAPTSLVCRLGGAQLIEVLLKVTIAETKTGVLLVVIKKHVINLKRDSELI